MEQLVCYVAINNNRMMRKVKGINMKYFFQKDKLIPSEELVMKDVVTTVLVELIWEWLKKMSANLSFDEIR